MADPRFFIVLLPYLLLGASAGLTDRRVPGWWAGAAFGALLLSYGAGAGRALAETVRRPAEDRAPLRTFAWMRAHVPPGARVWGFYDSSLVELDTGRAGVFLPVPPDRDEFRARLLDERIDLVYDAPLRFSLEPVKGLEDAAARWRRSTVWVRDARAFEPLHRDESEGTALYRVLPSDAFRDAYAAYRAAREDLDAGRWDEGFAGLEKALSLEPDQVCALNAYGATALLTGRHEALGRRRLERAVRLRPEDPLPRANLERLNGRG